MTVATATEDREMVDLMEKWDAENGVEGDDDDVSEGEEEFFGYDDMLEQYRREVNVTNNAFDYVVLGCSDLDKALDDFEEQTGVRPLMVVSQNRLGTKSARVAFEQCAFIEIIGPDPKQDPLPLADKLAAIPAGQLLPVHYAVRQSKGEELKKTAWKDMGFGCDQVTMVAKDKGMPWKWDMFFLEEHDEAGLLPIFINWGEAHHAAGKLPIVGALESVTVRGPPDSKVHTLLTGVSDMDVELGDEYFEISFSSPKGKTTYSGSNLVGISFPK